MEENSNTRKTVSSEGRPVVVQDYGRMADVNTDEEDVVEFKGSRSIRSRRSRKSVQSASRGKTGK